MLRAQKGAQRASFVSIPIVAAPSSPSRSRRPSRGPRALLRAIVVLLPVLALASALAAPVSAHHPGRATDRRIAPRLLPGSVLSDHGISVAVPQPGGFVWGELKFPDGTYQEVGVETTTDGRVFVSNRGSERAATLDQRYEVAAQGAGATGVSAVERTTTAGGSAECRDTYRKLYGWRLPRLDWRFNPAGTPAYLRDEDGRTSRVRAAIVRAQQNITGSDNRCDRGDRVGAKGAVLGDTRRHPNASREGHCTGGDGRSVIGFGDLPSYSIAMTCVYGLRQGIAAESDILINNGETRWAVSRAGCTGSELLLEAGMTHEFGHAYGLAHASVYRNPSLTMQPLVRACSPGHSTLGLGDMLGLEKKY